MRAPLVARERSPILSRRFRFESVQLEPYRLRPPPGGGPARPAARQSRDTDRRFVKNHKGRLTEKHGFLARTPDRGYVAFRECAATAELRALRELRSAISEQARLARARAKRAEDFQEFLRSRCARGRYDSAHRVDLANYERWLPKHLREAFKHYEEGVPLRVIENEAVDLMPSLDDRQLADLIYQLDRDVACAGEETDRKALDRWFG